MRLITFYLGLIVLKRCVFLRFDRLFRTIRPLLLLGCLADQVDAIRYTHAHEVKLYAESFGLIPRGRIINSSCLGFITLDAYDLALELKYWVWFIPIFLRICLSVPLFKFLSYFTSFPFSFLSLFALSNNLTIFPILSLLLFTFDNQFMA
jgi:hypothetical protein